MAEGYTYPENTIPLGIAVRILRTRNCDFPLLYGVANADKATKSLLMGKKESGQYIKNEHLEKFRNHLFQALPPEIRKNIEQVVTERSQQNSANILTGKRVYPRNAVPLRKAVEIFRTPSCDLEPLYILANENIRTHVYILGDRGSHQCIARECLWNFRCRLYSELPIEAMDELPPEIASKYETEFKRKAEMLPQEEDNQRAEITLLREHAVPLSEILHPFIVSLTQEERSELYTHIISENAATRRLIINRRGRYSIALQRIGNRGEQKRGVRLQAFKFFPEEIKEKMPLRVRRKYDLKQRRYELPIAVEPLCRNPDDTNHLISIVLTTPKLKRRARVRREGKRKPRKVNDTEMYYLRKLLFLELPEEYTRELPQKIQKQYGPKPSPLENTLQA